MFKEKKFYLNYLFYLITIFVLVFDLITKAVTDGVVFQDLIKGIVAVESYHNTGASFSIFSGSMVAQILFIILGIGVSCGLVLYSIFSKKQNLNWCFFVGVSLMVGGIIGNVIDRIFLGHVRDFISLQFMNFAVFNIADSALCVGVIFLIVWLIFFAFKDTKENKNGNKTNNS